MRRWLTSQISHVHFFMVIIGHITWTCHYECKKHLMIIKDNLMTIDYKLIAISNEKCPPSAPPPVPLAPSLLCVPACVAPVLFWPPVW